MKITTSWLKDHLDTKFNENQIIEKLTDIGLEVESVDTQSSDLDSFLIAKILKTEKHPDADRLRVCDVDIGKKESVKVVCGAANAKEGLHIDHDINMGHLKGCLNYFIKEFFEVDKIKMRFRPSHFPFTEPSAEVDIGYEIKDGKIVIGEGDKWLEILGCGMVHPNVLKNVKIDPKRFQGYAFGIGIDRLAMLKYGINDLRAFFDCDFRWLNHFGFDPLDVPSNYRGLSR